MNVYKEEDVITLIHGTVAENTNTKFTWVKNELNIIINDDSEIKKISEGKKFEFNFTKDFRKSSYDKDNIIGIIFLKFITYLI